jgi:hypothetical protein
MGGDTPPGLQGLELVISLLWFKNVKFLNEKQI